MSNKKFNETKNRINSKPPIDLSVFSGLFVSSFGLLFGFGLITITHFKFICNLLPCSLYHIYTLYSKVIRFDYFFVCLIFWFYRNRILQTLFIVTYFTLSQQMFILSAVKFRSHPLVFRLHIFFFFFLANIQNIIELLFRQAQSINPVFIVCLCVNLCIEMDWTHTHLILAMTTTNKDE